MSEWSKPLGLRTLAELLHLAAGLTVTAAVFAAGAWSYPVGRGTVRGVGWGTMLVVLAMGIGPLRRAWRQDRSSSRGDLA
ncbi:hypothetical protein [Sphingomonas bacterium]|uniref:hypothetical protein n=1 Tax=Sphingomonas bacterium TaxID=1895847 RepID=UPI0015768E9D|nr:hypothetical protein [Sphingomonas bacterium]